jgi:K+ transporter
MTDSTAAYRRLGSSAIRGVTPHCGGGADRLLHQTWSAYVGHETVVRRDDGGGLPGWLEALFALMQRNSVHVSDFFQLPPDAIEIGRQISI